MTEKKTFWIVFMENEAGYLYSYCFGHNSVADWKQVQGYIGHKKIKVDIGKMMDEKNAKIRQRNH